MAELCARHGQRLLPRVATITAVLLAGMSVGCDGQALGSKTEQAIGVATIGVGAAVAPVNPPIGIGIAVAGGGILIDGARREETEGGK